MERIVVRVDPEIIDLVPLYLEARRQDAQSIQEALEKRDLGLIAHLSHGMRGTGGSFGMDPVTDIGGAMEDAARQNDCAAIQTQLLLLKSYLDSIDVLAA